MVDKANEIVSSEESKEELEEILQQIPDEILMSVIADRLQQESGDEVKKVIQTISQKNFSGPIPPPSMLSEYEDVHSGLSDRIVTMAETQQKHRQSLEKSSVNAAIKAESRGQHYALFICTVIIAGALYLIDSGREISGSILAGGTLTGLAYIFITGKKRDSKSTSDND